MVPTPLLSRSDARPGYRDVPPLVALDRSARAATLLAGMGFRNLFNLMGGMLAWEANALPVVRSDGPAVGA